MSYAPTPADEAALKFWRKDGRWHCAIPRDDFATRAGFGWKTHGCVGHGETKASALAEWRINWRCAAFVADIY